MMEGEERNQKIKGDKRNAVDFQWHVVSFAKPGMELRFRDALSVRPKECSNIIEVYCPTHTVVKEYYRELRVSSRESSGDRLSDLRDKPLCPGTVFVLSTHEGLSDFIRSEFPEAFIRLSRRDDTDSKVEPITVPDEQMRLFMRFNENYADKVILLHRSFTDYVFNPKSNQPNETVRIIDGPMAGCTGYLSQIGRRKGLVFNIPNPYGGDPLTFAVTDVWNFNVVRLHNKESDRQTLATEKARAVDLLAGMLQSCGYTDMEELVKELHLIVESLSVNSSIPVFFKNIMSQRRRELLHETGMEARDEEHVTYLSNQLKRTERMSQLMAHLSSNDMELFLNLIRYEREQPGYVRGVWPKMIVRPFLTPISGVEIPDGCDTAVIDHTGYIELIRRVEIPEDVYHPKEGKTTHEISTYYAHVGLLRKDAKTTTVFADWDTFLRHYYHSGGMARHKLVDGTFPTNSINEDKRQLLESFRNYAPTLHNVLINPESRVKATADLQITFSMSLHALTVTAPIQSESEAIDCLINCGINIARELSTTTHLSPWRRYLATVWLHQ